MSFVSIFAASFRAGALVIVVLFVVRSVFVWRIKKKWGSEGGGGGGGAAD